MSDSGEETIDKAFPDVPVGPLEALKKRHKAESKSLQGKLGFFIFISIVHRYQCFIQLIIYAS